MSKYRISHYIRIITAVAAIIFGGLTTFIGGRTLLGIFDPGYLIFLPLLVFNTIMGLLYIVAGLMIWRNHNEALFAVQSIFLLNLAILGIIGILYLSTEQIAVESVGAMTFRTAVWFTIYGGMKFIKRD